MVDLRVVRGEVDQELLKIAEELVKRVKDGYIKGIVITTIDDQKRVDVRTKWSEPLSKLEMCGANRVAQILFDKIIMSKDIKVAPPDACRRASVEERANILEQKQDVVIFRSILSPEYKVVYFLVLGKSLRENNRLVILGDFVSEDGARAYCALHGLPCALEIFEWSNT